MYMVNFNMGYCVDGKEGLICYILDEKNTEVSLLYVSEEDFKAYVNELESNYIKFMEEYYDIKEDMIKLQNIDFKIFDPKILMDRYHPSNFKPFISDLGNLAVIKNYKPHTYNMVIDFLSNFPKIKEKVINNGREARNGVSILETYDRICKEELIPRFNTSIFGETK